MGGPQQRQTGSVGSCAYDLAYPCTTLITFIKFLGKHLHVNAKQSCDMFYLQNFWDLEDKNKFSFRHKLDRYQKQILRTKLSRFSTANTSEMYFVLEILK